MAFKREDGAWPVQSERAGFVFLALPCSILFLLFVPATALEMLGQHKSTHQVTENSHPGVPQQRQQWVGKMVPRESQMPSTGAPASCEAFPPYLHMKTMTLALVLQGEGRE